MLSYQARRCSQTGQRDGGETSDSPRGRRQTTTLRKLPTLAPRAKKKTMKSRCDILGRGILEQPDDVHHRLLRGKIRHVQFGGHDAAVDGLALGGELLDLLHRAGEVGEAGTHQAGGRVGLDSAVELGGVALEVDDLVIALFERL